MTQAAGAREATGRFTFDGVEYRPGFLQSTTDWYAVTASHDGHTISVIAGRKGSVDRLQFIVSIDGNHVWSSR